MNQHPSGTEGRNAEGTGVQSHGIATEPVLRRIADHYSGHPQYEVLLGDEVIGTIFGFNPTFERGSKHNRYVSTRWTSRRRYWCADYPGARGVYSLPYETRKRAAESLVWQWENR